jgi:peptidoglycan/LPS O-acetylase OafA/YrhL
LKLVRLEGLRGVAALTVVIAHLAPMTDARVSLGPFLGLCSWGRAAVITFFILSGVVIRLAYDRRPRGRLDFLGDRAVRLLPLYYTALGVAVLVHLALVGPPDLWTVLGHLIFLQSDDRHVLVPLWTNEPLWSLSYEIFFYLLFAATIGSRQKTGIAVWAVVAVATIGVQWLVPREGFGRFCVSLPGYSLLWVLGYYLHDIARVMAVGRVTALGAATLVPLASRVEIPGFEDPAAGDILAGIALAPLFVHTLQVEALHVIPGRRLPMSCLAWGFVLLLALTALPTSAIPRARLPHIILPLVAIPGFILASRWLGWPSRANRPALFLGRISYALYVIHFPIMRLADTLPAGFWVRAACYLCASFVTAILLEDYFQRSVVRWLRGRAPMRAPSDTHAGSYFGLESRTAGLAARSPES